MRDAARQLLLNLPVRDLERSKAFFASLGFEFDARFTNHQAAGMVVNEGAYVMLLVQPFFETFTGSDSGDTTEQTEAINAFSCSTRAEVDALTERALCAGATLARPALDRDFMYCQSFYDPDGHQWEVVWMAPPAAVETQ